MRHRWAPMRNALGTEGHTRWTITTARHRQAGGLTIRRWPVTASMNTPPFTACSSVPMSQYCVTSCTCRQGKEGWAGVVGGQGEPEQAKRQQVKRWGEA